MSTTIQVTDPKLTRSGKAYNTMSEVTVNVSPALTQFSEDNPRAWFLMAETRFHMNQITDDIGKTGKVLEALTPAVFNRIAPWLGTQSSTKIKYEELKEELLAFYTPSSQTRTKQILDMVNNPTEKPSDRYRRMEALSQDQDGNQLNWLWELWLISLPSSVRVQIQDSTLSKAKVIRKADSLLHQLEDDDGTQVMAAQKHNPRQRNNKYRRDDEREKIVDNLCWYHRRFGSDSKSCRDGCKHYATFTPAKNGTGGRQ